MISGYQVTTEWVIPLICRIAGGRLAPRHSHSRSTRPYKDIFYKTYKIGTIVIPLSS